MVQCLYHTGGYIFDYSKLCLLANSIFPRLLISWLAVGENLNWQFDTCSTRSVDDLEFRTVSEPVSYTHLVPNKIGQILFCLTLSCIFIIFQIFIPFLGSVIKFWNKNGFWFWLKFFYMWSPQIEFLRFYQFFYPLFGDLLFAKILKISKIK